MYCSRASEGLKNKDGTQTETISKLQKYNYHKSKSASPDFNFLLHYVRYNSAKKDNDFIYHESVPNLDTLAAVKGKKDTYLFIRITIIKSWFS